MQYMVKIRLTEEFEFPVEADTSAEAGETALDEFNKPGAGRKWVKNLRVTKDPERKIINVSRVDIQS